MLRRITRVLQEICLLSPEQPLLLGVSGGPDSLCMLDVLHKLGYNLIVCHLDHSLRSDSGTDSLSVQEFANERGVPFVLERFDVRVHAEELKTSIEEAARIKRYEFLFQAAMEYEAQAVAVGHNADDQVETVVMHLLRGAGLDGLKGMIYRSLPNAWSKNIPLVRPLLGVWREEILDYLEEKQLIPLQDSSNLDLQIYRNRLRHDLVPYLDGYKPGVRKRIWQMADLLAEDHFLLKRLTKDVMGNCILETNKDFVIIDHKALSVQPLGLQRRLLREAIARLRPDLRDIDYSAVERALDFVKEPSSSKQIDLVSGLRLVEEGNRLWLVNWDFDLPVDDWPQLSKNTEIQLTIPGEIQFANQWRLRCDVIQDLDLARNEARKSGDLNIAWMDLEKLTEPVIVRSRVPGDRIKPIGMDGKSMKLTEFMINIKLPKRLRDGWPLVLSGGEIAWAPGLRLAHPYRLREQTKRILRMSLDKH
jgi:tRNA(Ile)-lysidine synthase